LQVRSTTKPLTIPDGFLHGTLYTNILCIGAESWRFEINILVHELQPLTLVNMCVDMLICLPEPYKYHKNWKSWRFEINILVHELQPESWKFEINILVHELQPESWKFEINILKKARYFEHIFWGIKSSIFLYARKNFGHIMLYPLASVCPSVRPSVRPLAIWFPEHGPKYSNFIG
jgi:hypothetical protein